MTGEEVSVSMALPVDDVKLTISLVETLHGIRTDMAGGLGRVEKALDGKADKSDVDRLERSVEENRRADHRRLEVVESETRRLADEQRARDIAEKATATHIASERETRRRTWSVREKILTVGLTAAIALGAILAVFAH